MTNYNDGQDRSVKHEDVRVGHVYQYAGKLGAWTVTKVNKTTIDVRNEDGRAYRTRAYLLRKLLLGDNPNEHTPVDLNNIPRLGSVVTWTVPPREVARGDLFVVVNEKRDGNVSLVELGGNVQGRWWPSVATALLEVMDLETVASHITNVLAAGEGDD